MGLLLGQVSKWRAQRADGGAHAARSFVGGATSSQPLRTRRRNVSMPHAALWVVQLTTLVVSSGAQSGFNAARGFVGGAAPIEGATADSQNRFNAARGFVGGAALYHESYKSFRQSFNAARGFVGGAALVQRHSH